MLFTVICDLTKPNFTYGKFGLDSGSRITAKGRRKRLFCTLNRIMISTANNRGFTRFEPRFNFQKIIRTWSSYTKRCLNFICKSREDQYFNTSGFDPQVRRKHKSSTGNPMYSIKVSFCELKCAGIRRVVFWRTIVKRSKDWRPEAPFQWPSEWRPSKALQRQGIPSLRQALKRCQPQR